jgi:hypothetical protein
MKYLVKIILFFMILAGSALHQTLDSYEFSGNQRDILEHFQANQESHDTPQLFFNEAHSSKSSHPLAFVKIELKEKEVDDDEISETKSYLKNTLHFSLIYYLGDKGFFEALTSETFSHVTELLSSVADEILYLEFQVFRI